MSRTRHLHTSLIAALLAVVLVGSAASALPPQSVVGVIHEGPHEIIDIVNDASGATILTILGTDHVFEGTFDGTFSERHTLTILPDGTSTYDLTVFFEGVVAGSEPGEVQMAVTGLSTDGGATIVGTWAVLSNTATGGLVGLHGRGTWDLAGQTGNLWGSVHFDARTRSHATS
jgi:hypothetical protein